MCLVRQVHISPQRRHAGTSLQWELRRSKQEMCRAPQPRLVHRLPDKHRRGRKQQLLMETEADVHPRTKHARNLCRILPHSHVRKNPIASNCGEGARISAAKSGGIFCALS
jgi:hypothetical protein